MDKLARDAKNALKKGMSYGQYMAQKKPEIIAKILETYSMNFVVSFMKKIDRKEKRTS